MSLTILSVAYPFAPVTADPAGGAEQVLSQLDRTLAKAGHTSIVIACEGSETVGELIAIPSVEGDLGETERAVVHARLREALERTLRSRRVDLVHFHGIDFGAYLPPPGVAALVTLHLPLSWYETGWLRAGRPRTYLLPVSRDQASRAPDGVTLLPPIENGVDIDAYRPSLTKRDYALIIGRVAPEKGFHDAIDAARLAGVPLLAAGRLFPYPEHRRYFAEEVEPRLDAARRWIGPVSGETKRRLIAEARCLLVPSTAPETSSLVSMEALASGTPVVAYRAGALPDIVEHGVTGFLVDDAEGMADAIRRIGTIDPAVCRRIACECFPLGRTMRAYLDLYARLAA